MKILHIITYLEGGAGTAAIRLHKQLLESGINSHVLCLYKGSLEAEKIEVVNSKHNIINKVVNKFKINQDEINRNKLKNAPLYEHFSFCSSDYNITKHPLYKSADIVNLHWVSYLLDFKSFFKKNNKPLIWSLSDMNPFTGGCHYSNGCIKYISDYCTNCFQLTGTEDENNAHYNLLKKVKSLHKTSQKPLIITPANWMYKKAKKSLMFKSLEHHIIPHPSDEKVYFLKNKSEKKKKFELPSDKTIFLFMSVSLENKRKGGNYLFEIFKDFPEPFHLLIVGDVYAETSNKMKRVFNNNYTLLPKMKNEKKLAEVYCAADATLILSLEDNLPLTMIDSLMSGTPVIAFKNGGMKDYIVSGVNGYIVSETNAFKMKKSIKLFIQNKHNFINKKIAENAFSIFSGKSHAEKYNDLYNDLLQKKI